MSTQFAPFQKKLEAELERVTADLRELGVHNPDNPDDWVATPEDDMSGEADIDLVADGVESLDERMSTLALLETEYNNIRRALNKLASDTYGTCEVCNERIEHERLDANPSARTCIAHREEEATL